MFILLCLLFTPLWVVVQTQTVQATPHTLHDATVCKTTAANNLT